MKIVFLGTARIAVPSLEKLINSRHEVIAVITQPDQKSGRGMNVSFSPVKETALKYDIICYQPERIGEESVLDMLEGMGADVFAVAAYAQKLPDRLLNMAPFGCINMHPSLLPLYRGSGPLRGPILNGDKQTGVTVMKLSSEWDAGDILMQKAFDMDPKETRESLEGKCAELGAQLMLETVNALEAGTITPVPQDHSKAVYLKQIKKEEGIIDFNESAVYIERLIRSCIPWPSAYTFLDGKTFKIWDADAVDKLPDDGTEEPSAAGEGDSALGSEETAFADAAKSVLPGTAAYVDKKNLYIRTGNGYLKPLSVQLEGRKRMSTEEFLRGKKIEKGCRFGRV